MTFIDEIYDFNLKAGLLNRPYSDILESSFQIEEALEGFDLRRLWASLKGFTPAVATIAAGNDGLNEVLTAKDVARTIIYDNVTTDSSVEALCTDYLTDVDRLDKAIDALVFAVGSMAKLKLTPEQITRAISVVTQANLQKLSMPKDEFGKLQKPADFVGPETQLQSILDERKL